LGGGAGQDDGEGIKKATVGSAERCFAAVSSCSYGACYPCYSRALARRDSRCSGVLRGC